MMPPSYALLHYRVIFGTENRVPLITQTLRVCLYSCIGGIIRDNDRLSYVERHLRT